jgi:hypothetical protein
MQFGKSILAATAVAALLITTLSAQDPQGTRPVVSVTMQQTGESDVALQALSESIGNTLKLTLSYLGKYELTATAEQMESADITTLRRRAQAGNIDNIVFGRVGRDGEGRVGIELSVFDRYEDAVTVVQQGTAESIFDVFDLADALLVSLIEGFSGVRVEYGDLAIEYIGEPLALVLQIDGRPLAGNPQSVPRLVAGEHRIVVRPVDPGSDPSRVFIDDTVAILAGRTTRLEINLPYLDDEETARLARLNRAIAAGWYDGSRQAEVESSFQEAFELLRSSRAVGAPESLASYEAWYRRYREPVTTTAFEPTLALKKAIALTRTPNNIPADERLSPQDSLGPLYSSERHRMFPFRRIAIDGDPSDWEGIKPFARDAVGDSEAGRTGSDIAALYIAMDWDYTYIRLDLADGAPNEDNWYNVDSYVTERDRSLVMQTIYRNNRWVSRLKIFDHARKSDAAPDVVDRAAVGDNFLEARFPNKDIIELVAPQASLTPLSAGTGLDNGGQADGVGTNLQTRWPYYIYRRDF